MKKAVLYLNQFFGQIGGEDMADFEPQIIEGAIGPGVELDRRLGEDIKLTHTIICGDNFMGSRQEEAIDKILKFLEGIEFDIFFAGPAFRAGRYGSACGNICKAVKEKFNVPTITSMNEENPGVEMFRKHIYIFKGGASAASMRKDIATMARFAVKVLNNEKLLSAEEEGYYSRGIRHQIWIDTPATERVIDMLLKKIYNQPYKTELPIDPPQLVPIANYIKDLSKAKIALATSGGIVPVDNPDKIQSASATRWGKYDITGLDRLEKGVYKTIHAGYDPAAADEDPNVVVPLDALRQYEKEGKIGCVHNFFYTTVGTGTTQAEASRMGKEIAKDMKLNKVDAVILTST
ncbi:glycine reductase [Alkalithermobacter thermoalcaliphilus JW-YL-7 = DSM 7308]|nr:selenoprotein B, glycine/betaine/sarcosine/D-proline reductase family [[Clostridium] paradoxum JW-YL-7 = DSM 7308]SHL16592.1 glycine reductase [[Clostridium] paradoxum JW-YL-7 = DSM 7308]